MVPLRVCNVYVMCSDLCSWIELTKLSTIPYDLTLHFVFFFSPYFFYPTHFSVAYSTAPFVRSIWEITWVYCLWWLFRRDYTIKFKRETNQPLSAPDSSMDFASADFLLLWKRTVASLRWIMVAVLLAVLILAVVATGCPPAAVFFLTLRFTTPSGSSIIFRMAAWSEASIGATEISRTARNLPQLFKCSFSKRKKFQTKRLEWTTWISKKIR